MRRLTVYSLCCLSVGIIAWGALWATFPLGVPDEWTWNRAAIQENSGLALVPVLVVAGLYLGFAGLGVRSLDSCGRWGRGAWLGGLVIAGFAWLWLAQESAPDNYRLSKAVWILYYRGSSGYFSEARESGRDLPAYLAHYQQKMAERDVLHIGTHPPGLVVVFRGLFVLCEASPILVDLLQSIEPASVADAFDELKQHESLSRTDRAVLWLAALLVQLAAALTVVPLYNLCRLTCSRRASWQAVVFFPAIPALSVFLPKSDCLFPCLAATFLWLWLSGLTRGVYWRCLLAGVVSWAALSLSLAFLPVGFLALLAAVGNWGFPRWRGLQTAAPQDSVVPPPESTGVRNSRIWLAAAAAVGFCLPLIAAWWWGQINLLHVWRLNFANHAGFYEQFSRTYWKWLLINPLEFAVAAGLPLVVWIGWSLVRRGRPQLTGRGTLAVAWLVTGVLLWISGKNMGEAARLWIFLTPGLILVAAPLFDVPVVAGSDASRPLATGVMPCGRSGGISADWLVVLSAQLLGTALLVARVTGFHIPVAVASSEWSPPANVSPTFRDSLPRPARVHVPPVV